MEQIEDLLHPRNKMLDYSSYISKELADKLIEVGCPILTHKLLNPIIDHIGSNAMAMRLDSKGNPNGVINTDPTTYKGFEEELKYELPTYEQVVNWLEKEYNIIIGTLYSIGSKTRYGLVWYKETPENFPPKDKQSKGVYILVDSPTKKVE